MKKAASLFIVVLLMLASLLLAMTACAEPPEGISGDGDSSHPTTPTVYSDTQKISPPDFSQKEIAEKYTFQRVAELYE